MGGPTSCYPSSLAVDGSGTGGSHADAAVVLRAAEKTGPMQPVVDRAGAVAQASGPP